MSKMLTALSLILILCLGGCASPTPETSPEPDGIPKETLDAIADYIADNTEGRIDKDKVYVSENDGKVDISVSRGMGQVEDTFGLACEIVVEAMNAALTEHGVELNKLTVTAVSSANKDNKVIWTTSDGVSGNLVDTREDGIPGGRYDVADIAGAFSN